VALKGLSWSCYQHSFSAGLAAISAPARHPCYFSCSVKRQTPAAAPASFFHGKELKMKLSDMRLWPSEPTRRNFRRQARALNRHLRKNGGDIRKIAVSLSTNPENRTASRRALKRLGLCALATEDGLDFLLRRYILKPESADSGRNT
jgi:hypothetical protein